MIGFMEGRIVRGVGGFYYVVSGGIEYECRARGNFRVRDKKPLVGDNVKFEAETGKTGYILEILPRRNELKRPQVANIDQLVVVIAPREPKPDLLLVDKLMLYARIMEIELALCINKCDKGSREELDELCGEYEDSCPVLIASAVKGDGIEQLRSALLGKVTCFAGQSAVGKSSLINALSPSQGLETGGLSKKTERGKHTTRHASLLSLGDGFVVDTPGFSLLELPALEPERLAEYYPEMQPCLGQCYFSGCLHVSEPDCAVKEHAGSFSGRYERYKALLETFIEMRDKKYD